MNIQDFKNQANFQYSFYRKLCNMNERIKVFNTNFCNRRTKFQEQYLQNKDTIKSTFRNRNKKKTHVEKKASRMSQSS